MLKKVPTGVQQPATFKTLIIEFILIKRKRSQHSTSRFQGWCIPNANTTGMGSHLRKRINMKTAGKLNKQKKSHRVFRTRPVLGRDWSEASFRRLLYIYFIFQQRLWWRKKHRGPRGEHCKDICRFFSHKKRWGTLTEKSPSFLKRTILKSYYFIFKYFYKIK